MAILLQDGFETGIGLWTVQILGIGVVPTLNTDLAFVKAGTQSVRFYCGGQGVVPFAESISGLRRIGINARNIYVRGWFYLAQGLGGFQAYDRFSLIRLNDASGHMLLNLSPRRETTNSPIRWGLWCATDNGGTGTHHYGASVVDTTPRWVCLEVHFNADSGLFELWVTDNNVTTLEVTWKNPLPVGGFSAVDRVGIGIDRPSSTAAGPPTGQYISDVYGDEIVFADAYIGSGAVTNPKLTVNSNPELNVPVYVDEQFMGNTPITVELVAGTHTVRVEGEVTR